ncbi:MAG: hypothetical protein NTV86_09520 [Planctomycetota bacterium]|nr:hypothetical protein [Planctomycetota bacterium]
MEKARKKTEAEVDVLRAAVLAAVPVGKKKAKRKQEIRWAVSSVRSPARVFDKQEAAARAVVLRAIGKAGAEAIRDICEDSDIAPVLAKLKEEGAVHGEGTGSRFRYWR